MRFAYLFPSYSAALGTMHLYFTARPRRQCVTFDGAVAERVTMG